MSIGSTPLRFKVDLDTERCMKCGRCVENCSYGVFRKEGDTIVVANSRACVACHREDDAHKEALGTDCAACHGEKEWRADIRFDHDLTKFPLAGLHATTACVACHADRKFRGTPAACLDCHRKDDVHKGALGKACQDCHTPNDWRIWTFDHDTRTDFALTGAHSTLRCASCHVRPPGEGRPMSDDCGTCHRRDDVHGGQFGSDCARCHNTRTFSGATRKPR